MFDRAVGGRAPWLRRSTGLTRVGGTSGVVSLLGLGCGRFVVAHVAMTGTG